MESGSSRTTLEGSGNLNLFCRETVLGRPGQFLRATHLQGRWLGAEMLHLMSNVTSSDNEKERGTECESRLAQDCQAAALSLAHLVAP